MKKSLLRNFIVCAVFGFVLIGCKKEAVSPQVEEISENTLERISKLGFSNKNVVTHEDGYLVEGDIVITEQDLNRVPQSQFLRIGGEEQYRTYNLVKSLPRTIKVSISSKFSSSYVAALDEALARYNALGLNLTFQRVSSGANISIVKITGGNYLASAGFPTSTGNPYSQVKVNTRAIGNQPLGTVASILAHEIGHCIGFRHTDYMSRQYSCGGSAVNEGASTVGAEHIPGTPTGPDAGSWMLACIGSGQNRPFTSNDRTALNYLY